MKICYGSTRTVFLIGTLAIKIPSMTKFRLFLYGLLANMQEVEFSKANFPELCPVIFYLPFGLFIVMKRCDCLTREQFEQFDYEKFTIHENYVLTFIENKFDSFGILDGKIVAVDYGS